MENVLENLKNLIVGDKSVGADIMECISFIDSVSGTSAYMDDMYLENQNLLLAFKNEGIKMGYKVIEIEGIYGLALAKDDELFSYIKKFMKFNMFDVPDRNVLMEMITDGEI
jgi:hypothetical protein